MVEAAAMIDVLRGFGVAARHAERLSGGLISDSFLVDGRWVVRVPRLDAAGLRRELDVLAALGSLPGYSVPDVEILGTHEGRPVAIHRVIGGSQATDAWYRSDRGIDEVARLLRAIHGASPDLPRIGPAGWADRLRSFLDDVTRSLAGHALEPRAHVASGDFLRLLDGLERTVFIHNDLGPDHMLVRDGTIVGVIDWSEAGWGDPARDLVGVRIAAGTDAAAAVAARGGLDDQAKTRVDHYYWFDSAHLIANAGRIGQEHLIGPAFDELDRRLADVGY